MPLERSAKKLIEYWEMLADERRHFDDMWQEVADHSLGRRDFLSKRVPGRQRMTRIYDTTSRDSNNLLKAALHALLTNPATNWLDCRWQFDILNEIDTLVRYLDLVKQRLRIAFTRPRSGFATQIAEIYDDGPGFGNASLWVREDPVIGSVFVARPIAEIYIDVDSDGNVVSLFRKFSLKPWQALDQFGDNAPSTAATLADKNPNVDMAFLHHIRKRDLVLPRNIDASGMEWESIYIAIDSNEVILEEGFREFPMMYWRWAVDAGEKHGRGPGVDSLPDQKMLNAMSRSFIRTSEKMADPPVLVDDDGVMPGSQVRITPSAQIVVRNDGGAREPVRYLESRAQMQWPAELIANRQAKIEKHFHSEIIKAFQDPRMTATQVLELARLSQRILSPVMGRAQKDLLDPMVQRVLAVEMRRRDFPRPPQDVIDVLRALNMTLLEAIQIEYVSPVARAQKAAEAQAILDTFGASAALAEADPGVLDNMDLDEAFREIAVANGVPVSVIRSREDVAAKREADARLAAQEAQQQQLLATGDTVSKLLPGIASLADQQRQAAAA